MSSLPLPNRNAAHTTAIGRRLAVSSDTNAPRNRGPTNSPSRQEFSRSPIQRSREFRRTQTQLKIKRREDAYALPKLRETEKPLGVDFARSALECDASSHRFEIVYSATTMSPQDIRCAAQQKSKIEKRNWLRGLDLNQRPSGYEPDELPGCSTPRSNYGDAGAEIKPKSFRWNDLID